MESAAPARREKPGHASPLGNSGMKEIDDA